MRVTKRMLPRLAATAVLCATSALAEDMPWAHPGYWGWPCHGDNNWSFCNPGPDDPVDSAAPEADFPGEADDQLGFGTWGPSGAGEQQPGLGAPFSGPRPPELEAVGALLSQ